jgi:hypothetical protein
MTGREARTTKALKQLYQVCTGEVRKGVPDLPKQFSVQTARLGKMLAELDELQTTRVSRAPFHGARAHRNRILERIVDEFLKPMHKIGRVQDAADPGFAAPFVVPRPRSAIGDFVKAARAVAQAAEQHQSVFVEGGLEDDFIQQLRSLADQLEAQADVAAISRMGRGQAARDVRALLKEGRRISVLLDTIFQRHCARLHNNPASNIASLAGVLEVWTRALRVERDPVRRARRLKPVL